MQRLYASPNFPMVGHLRQVLEDHHVRCFVKNEHLMGAAGELPLFECWPEIWIADDGDLDRARALMDAFLGPASDPDPGAAWTCPRCKEPLEPQFDTCWRCGEGRPDGTSDLP